MSERLYLPTEEYPLLPGEKLFKVVEKEVLLPDTPLDSKRELFLLAGKHPDDTTPDFPRPADASRVPDYLNTMSDVEFLRLYAALFARDAMFTAKAVLPLYPRLTYRTLRDLAKLQGVKYDLYREEDEGKVIHEDRAVNDPIAIKLTEKVSRGWPYSGAADTTPDYIRLFTDYTRQDNQYLSFLGETYGARDGSEKTMLDSFDTAIGWVLRQLDKSDAGLLEFKPAYPGSISNQAWRDSWDGYPHADGTLANSKEGIASIEVQQITYDALLDAADLYDRLGKPELTSALRAEADRLGAYVKDKFWVSNRGGYFALGLDRIPGTHQLRQLAVKTSNMGHLLDSRLLTSNDPDDQERVRLIIKQLFSEEMCNGSGIRTLASSEERFRPDAYHNGTVWPRETFLIARGLVRHGYYGLARDLLERVVNIHQTLGVFPEYVRGDNSKTPSINTREIRLWDSAHNRENLVAQVPQLVQAWTVAAVEAAYYLLSLLPPRATDSEKRGFEQAILRKAPPFSKAA